jgi:hypothetical protein
VVPLCQSLRFNVKVAGTLQQGVRFPAAPCRNVSTDVLGISRTPCGIWPPSAA